MKFCLLYNTDYYPEVHGSASTYYNQILEQVVCAEALGFDAVWFGEHHYAGYSFGSPPVIAIAAAARTTTIRLGTGVSLIPLNHPLRLAEEYAMLDVLSGGRLEYGIGRGFLQYSYELFGVDPEESQARYHEGTDLILRSWTSSGPFSYHGAFWDFEDYTFFPKPLQQPHPPICAAGARTPESYIWAGRNGFHLCTAFFAPNQDSIRKGIALYRQALQEHGHNPAEKEVAGVFQFYCGVSNEEAHRNGGSHVFNYFRFFDALRRRSPHTSQAFQHHQGQGVDATGGLSYADFDARNLILIGDPENLIARIRWAQEFYGANYLILEVAQGGMPPQYIVPSLERFARHVMPVFRHA